MGMPIEELIAKAKERMAAKKAEEKAILDQQQQQIDKQKTVAIPALHTKGWKIDNSADWNEEQTSAIDAALASRSFCLIGAAGTGKTTTLKGIIRSLIANNVVPIIPGMRETKWLKGGTPGIVLCSFTNMAVRQIAKHFSEDITCVTIHKLLEFAPVKYLVDDPKNPGEKIATMRFEPSRHKNNPLPRELKTIVVDEASMVDIDLFELLLDALPNPSAVQFIFLGDLNQLPPVYGGPILGRKLLELPIIELVRVYRQALQSPIIRYALEMKDGKGTKVSGGQPIKVDNGEHGIVTIHPWSKAIGWEDALAKMQGFLKAAIRDKYIDIQQDMILCPYNVNFGVIELNRAIADYLGKERNAVVWEIIAGYKTHYYAVGDKVLASKQEAYIVGIERNPKFFGKQPLDPDLFDIDRFGHGKKRQQIDPSAEYKAGYDVDVDALLESMSTTEVQDRVVACSHRIYLVPKDLYQEQLEAGMSLQDMRKETSWILESAAEVNEMLFGYCITVHKSQGSEWRRVFLITHQSQAKMLSRELMYTAMTRARKELYMVVEPDRGLKPGTLLKAANSPRLKGNTLAEKLISLKERFAKEALEKQRQKTITEEDNDD